MSNKKTPTEVLNYLASIPNLAHTIVERKVAKEVLLSTDGQMMAQGILWKIQAKPAGAGLIELTLKKY